MSQNAGATDGAGLTTADGAADGMLLPSHVGTASDNSKVLALVSAALIVNSAPVKDGFCVT